MKDKQEVETSKLVAYNNNFTFVKDKQEAIKKLKEKNLAFGWFNGEFISVDNK